MSLLEVNLLSPTQPLFEGKAKEVRIPSFAGQMGILPGHTKLISLLGLGDLDIFTDDGKISHYFVSGGYIQVEHDKVNVLVDVVESAATIDLERADQAASRAVERLNDRQNLDVDVPRALTSLARAKARKRLVEKSKKSK